MVCLIVADVTQIMESDEEEEILVSVGDRQVPFHEAAELVEDMTDSQRDAYNKIACSVYSDMYD